MSSSEVTIPDEAWTAVVSAVPIKDVIAALGSAWEINEIQERSIRAAAPLILAAELEARAEELNCGDDYAVLMYRARELRGEV